MLILFFIYYLSHICFFKIHIVECPFYNMLLGYIAASYFIVKSILSFSPRHTLLWFQFDMFLFDNIFLFFLFLFIFLTGNKSIRSLSSASSLRLNHKAMPEYHCKYDMAIKPKGFGTTFHYEMTSMVIKYLFQGWVSPICSSYEPLLTRYFSQI